MSEPETEAANDIESVSLIVTAFVSNEQNRVAANELPSLIQSVANSLRTLSSPEPEPTPAATPAIPIRRSVTPDRIVCLDCGRGFRSIKRHLMAAHDQTPPEYRAAWGLSKDYPTVAPAYAAARSELAKQSGLGQGGRKPAGARAAAKSAGGLKG